MKKSSRRSAMTPGRRTALLAGLAIGVILICLAFTDEARIQYFLYRMKTGGSDYFLQIIDSPEGTAGQKAVTRFVATAPGRQRLVSVTLKAMLSEYDKLRRDGSWPSLHDVDNLLSLSGMVFLPSYNAWVLWLEIRGSGKNLISMSAIRPPFARGETLAGLLDIMCNEMTPGDEVRLPEYPRLRVRVQPFDKGLKLYQDEISASARGKSSSGLWSETLRSWPELLETESLLPWVLYMDLRPPSGGS